MTLTKSRLGKLGLLAGLAAIGTLIVVGAADAHPKKHKRLAKRFAKLDANADGMLSAAEVAHTRLAKGFMKMDADGDGLLTVAEVKKARRLRKATRGKSKANKGKGHVNWKRGNNNHRNRANRLKALDTDSDGKLSAAEVANTPGLSKRFARLDKNSDGFITKAELKKGRRGHKGKHKGKRKGKRKGHHKGVGKPQSGATN